MLGGLALAAAIGLCVISVEKSRLWAFRKALSIDSTNAKALAGVTSLEEVLRLTAADEDI